ncbi:hypothetical protein [Clostridium folliculivorans]|uniref:Uncharacterized protein n=1 Tax=Clostridium folliculivorans TaxID=2886038 RepID=A0A9W5Y150_9CLOT|nr:hypothetical protein [Clostridium folliculivorans]GKU24671.1 hypothetical protein CFOLD11_14970 [Clostridium folliculivorans]GKU30769.1 hypothetical protein CFB3_28760 [Clostridium folliculivorans]
MIDNGEEFLSMHPTQRKWINKCSMCHHRGYKPNILEQLYPYPPTETRNLRCYFKPLALNNDGICDDCNKLLKQKQNETY